MPEAPTGTASGCGSESSAPWPSEPVWRSPCATSRPAPASGTIEHRLWAQVTSNWRGQPLTSREVVVNLIGATTTRTGLSVHAELDEGTYPKGIKVTDSEMAAIGPHLERHEFHGEWNYTLRPPRSR